MSVSSIWAPLLLAIGGSHALEQVHQHGYPASGGLGLRLARRLGPALLEAVTPFLTDIAAVGIKPYPRQTVVEVSATHAE
jgi:hypothetical protein